jgi:hypothetical protein
MGEMRNTYRILGEKPDGKGSLGRPNVNGKLVLKWISGKES